MAPTSGPDVSAETGGERRWTSWLIGQREGAERVDAHAGPAASGLLREGEREWRGMLGPARKQAHAVE